MTDRVPTSITERYTADGIHAYGAGVTIAPYGGAYLVCTLAPGSSTHGARYYCVASYEEALERANHWLTKTLPRRLARGGK
jgi:hypothetical protein